MQFVWLLSIVFALIAAVSGLNCPANFQQENNNCVANRPIHGECPSGSVYSANINKCVYSARG